MLHLNPPLVDQGSIDDFKRSGRTLSATWSHRDDSLAVFPSNNADPHLLKASRSLVHPIYFTAQHQAPTAERRTFVTDTSVIFAAVQNFVNVALANERELLRNDAIQRTLRKLTIDYTNFCKECWVYCSRDGAKSEPLQLDTDHYRKLYSCLSLFCVLYLPENGLEDAPVGDELMDWLNRLYVEPSTDEADHLSGLDRPWEDESFWSFLSRVILRGLSKVSAFFLDLLSQHPSPHLQQLAEHLIPLLTNHPRLSNFLAERDFAIASRRWKERVKALRIELDRVPEDGREDGFDNWWERFSDIVGVLEGRGEVLKRLCVELGGDWKVVSIAWSIFIDPRLRRQDLPDIVLEVLDEMPPDPTNLEDAIHSSLFLGKPTQVLSQAYNLDAWLSAHVADIMEPLELIDRDTNDSGLSLREFYILAYTEYLRSDSGLWRLTVDYMCSCGPIGKEMADQVLVHVPLRLHRPARGGELTEEESKIRSGDLVGVLKEVNASCFDHRREVARRTVCKIAAQTFLVEKEYALAISYCTSAEDWLGLGRIVECVLEEYIMQGSATFARLVANIAPSLHTLRTQPADGVFLYRLMFAVRFAEFHQRRLNGDLQDAALDIVVMLRDDIAPKSWWAVVLCDAVELLQNSDLMLFTLDEACLLLRRLEEICSRTVQGSGSDYLSVLVRTTKSRDEKHALQRLQMVRLALAKYYARCGVIGVGGRVTAVPNR